MLERIRPFSNGFEWDCWQERNCEVCPLAYNERARRYDCEIQEALDLASIDDGTISAVIATKMGFPGDRSTRLGWPCAHRLKVRDFGPSGIQVLPIDQQLRAAGAPMLPGMEET
jgi:hypothetical protein